MQQMNYIFEVIDEWNKLGGTKDYVGNPYQQFLGAHGLKQFFIEKTRPMSLRWIDYRTPTYIERRLAE